MRKQRCGVYLLISQDGDQFYAGQTKDINARYDAETRSRCVAFVPEPDKYRRLYVESEAIEFLQAFGAPIWNVQKNKGR